jgi:isocitrate/isopropylmalate dehydrogenase
VDASTLKKEVAEGVDLMVVRELTGGQYTLKGIEVHRYCEWFILLVVIMYSVIFFLN